MTSKISSVKLFRESLKRNAPMGVLLALIYFIVYPVCGSILMQSMTRYSSTYWVMTTVRDYLALNPFAIGFNGCVAGVMGILQFAWLHSTEKVDFYHSLPVRRETYFAIQYIGGVALWFVPFVINLLMITVIMGVGGVLPAGIWWLICKSLCAHLATFLLIYSFMVLAMMLTGKIFVGILGMGVFCGYGSAVGLLLAACCEMYLNTFYAAVNWARYICLSPLYGCVKLWLGLAEGRMRDIFLGLLLLSALVTFLALIFYRRRGSEAAGHAIAFVKAERVIKFLIVVPVAVASQMLFYGVGEGSEFWGIFGLIFGLLLISALIEFIYHMDIREVLCDKKQILLSLAAAVAILAVFRMDLIGYDRWRPSADEIESVTLNPEFPEIGRIWSQYMIVKLEDGTPCYVQESYLGDSDVELNAEDAKLLLKAIDEDSGNEERWRNLWVTWRMKDGTTKQRSYLIDGKRESLNELWKREYIQDQYFKVLRAEPEDLLQVAATDTANWGYGFYHGKLDKEQSLERVDPRQILEEGSEYELNLYETDMADQGNFILDQKQSAELLECFKKELRGVLLEDMFDGSSYQIFFLFTDKDGTVYGENYWLSEEKMPKTMALLEKYGFSFEK